MASNKERIYKLKEPVHFGDDVIEEVTITRKLKFLRSHSLSVRVSDNNEVGLNLDFGTIIDLGSKMIGHPPAVIDEMHEDDQGEIMEAARDFLLSALGTGKKESQ